MTAQYLLFPTSEAAPVITWQDNVLQHSTSHLIVSGAGDAPLLALSTSEEMKTAVVVSAKKAGSGDRQSVRKREN